jgi:hypothetical protein
MNQLEMISKINEIIPEALPVSTELFYSTGGDISGIWLRGSEEWASDGLRIFNYYESDGNTLHPVLFELIQKSGWYEQPYDCGTCFLFSEQ